MRRIDPSAEKMENRRRSAVMGFLRSSALVVDHRVADGGGDVGTALPALGDDVRDTVPLHRLHGHLLGFDDVHESHGRADDEGGPHLALLHQLAEPHQCRGRVADGEYDGLLPADIRAALHADRRTGASAVLGLGHDVLVADVAVDVPAVGAELLLVDARGRHLGVRDDVRPGADGRDPLLRRSLGEHQVVRVVEVGGGVDAPLHDGELGLGPGAAVELRRDDLHAALLDILGSHYLDGQIARLPRSCSPWV